MRTVPLTILATTMSIAITATTIPAMGQDFELPSRKSGLWEIEMSAAIPGLPAMAMQACVDEASDVAMMQAGMSMSKETCPDQTMKREGDAYIIDSTCQTGPATTKSHIVVTGDFQSAYTVDITMETTGAAGPMDGTTTMKQEARWVGADCGGLAPGEIQMPGGVKMNVDDIMNMMGGG